MFWIPFGGRIKDDLVFEAEGAAFAPLQAMPFIDNGTKWDYVQEGLNQLFKFHNPKAQNECGCGESFGGLRRYYVVIY